jgi:hypothetical protein
MKKIVFITLALLIFHNVYSQHEKGNWQWYMYFKAGVKHNFSVYNNVSSSTNRIIKIPTGFERIIAVSSTEIDINPISSLKKEDFTFSFPVGFYFASPVFLTTGIEYQPIVFRNFYRTNSIDQDGYFYYLDELNTMQSLSIPLFFDTRRIYQKLTAYAGIRFHANLQNWQLQKVSWDNTKKLRKINIDSDEISTTGMSYAIGVNYSFLAVEFSLYPESFFNTSYIDEFGMVEYEYLKNKSVKSLTFSVMIGKLKKR